MPPVRRAGRAVDARARTERHGTEDALRALIADDPYLGQTREHPHLFIFARPGARRTEVFRGVIGGGPHWQPFLGLLTATVNDPVRPMYASANRGPHALLETLIMGPRLTTGGVTLASWHRSSPTASGEEHHQELTIDEDGGLSFFHAHAGWESEPVNGVSQKVLSSRTIVGSTREFIAAAVAISC